MSLRVLSPYEKVMELMSSHQPTSAITHIRLKKFKHLYVEYIYLQRKTEAFEKIISDINEDITFAHNMAWATAEKDLISQKVKAEKEVKMTSKVQKKLESKMDKIVSYAPIQKMIQIEEQKKRDARKELEKKYGKICW